MTLSTTEQTLCVQSAIYLMGLGTPPLPRQGAIAIVAVLYRESKLNPGSQGKQPTETPGVLNPEGAYGIASWNGPRQAKFQAFCTHYGIPVDNLQSQLRFVLNEMANSYPKSWAMITSPASSYQAAIPIIVAEYENPADITTETRDAISIANEFQALVPTTAAPPPPVATTPASSGPITMDPAVATFIAQVLPTILALVNPIIQSIVQAQMAAILQHITGMAQAGTLPKLPAPAVPTQPGAINWAQALQELGQIIQTATQPPTK